MAWMGLEGDHEGPFGLPQWLGGHVPKGSSSSMVPDIADIGDSEP